MKIEKKRGGNRACSIGARFNDSNEGHTPIIDMFEYLSKELNWNDTQIVTAAMSLLYEKLSSGEKITHNLSTGNVTQRMVELVETAQKLQYETIKLLRNGIAAQATMADVQTTYQEFDETALEVEQIGVLEGASGYAGQLTIVDDDEDDNDGW